jgi:hypothetical protein
VVPCGAQVAFVPDGLEAIIFTADGDMRQALNNLQARCCVLFSTVNSASLPDTYSASAGAFSAAPAVSSLMRCASCLGVRTFCS